jgi:hypothetical protein
MDVDEKEGSFFVENGVNAAVASIICPLIEISKVYLVINSPQTKMSCAAECGRVK